MGIVSDDESDKVHVPSVSIVGDPQLKSLMISSLDSLEVKDIEVGLIPPLTR